MRMLHRIRPRLTRSLRRFVKTIPNAPSLLQVRPEAGEIANASVEHRRIDVRARERSAIFGMPPARIFDRRDYPTVLRVQAGREVLAESPHRFEASAVGLPDVDLPRVAPLVAEIDAPVKAVREIRRPADRFVAKVHAMRMQLRRKATAEAEERVEVEHLSHEVDVEIAPRHQIQRVTADDVNVAVLGEQGSQTAVQKSVGFSPE
jgi:hypothetical protein